MSERFPYFACDYSRQLAERCPEFAKQVNPDPREEEEDEFDVDPFDEEGEAAGCFGLKQRFPDRVLVMASDSCFMNCRHCTRKGILHQSGIVRTDEELQSCVSYVQDHPQVRDVLIYRLLADETVDERIMEILKTKQNLFDNFADESVVGEESLKPDEQDWIANMVAEEKKRLLASGAGSTQEDTAGVQ